MSEESYKHPHPNLITAFAAAQAEFIDPTRNKAGQARGAKYNYVTLDQLFEAVRPILGKHGIAYTCVVERAGDKFEAVGRLMFHNPATGPEELRSVWPLSLSGGPQERGSELTYATRYLLAKLFGVADSDDDDGSSAQKRADLERRLSFTDGRKTLATALNERGFDDVAAFLRHLNWKRAERKVDTIDFANMPTAQLEELTAKIRGGALDATIDELKKLKKEQK